MTWNQRKTSKLISAREAVKKIPPGGRIVVGGGAGTPMALMRALCEESSAFRDNELIHIMLLGDLDITKDAYQDNFRDNSLFIGSNLRQSVQKGLADYTPIFLSEIPRLFASTSFPLSAALVSVSPPDKNGMCSLGVSVDINRAAIEHAQIVIAQVNRNMPQTFGQSLVPYSAFDYVVESDEPLPIVESLASEGVTEKIGQHISKLIPDGAVLQLGIGGIPDAVLRNLREANDLGIHTETFSDGVVELMKRGNITNSTKKVLKGRTLSALTFGTNELYEFIHQNPLFEFYPTDFVNDPFIISQNEKMISINSALQVDLTGQVCADSIGSKFFSGIGGQVDFVRGASRSKGGKSIIAFPSTAKNGTVSRIVGQLSPGAGVVTSRGDVHYIVTEYGVAYLHGKTIRQRAIELIHISHPKFRDELLEFVKDNHYVHFDQKSFKQLKSYPESYERKVKFKDKEFIFRPLKMTDERRLQDFFYSLSKETLYHRFFKIPESLPHEAAQRLVNVDYDRNMAMVILEPGQFEDKIVAVARYSGSPTDPYVDYTSVVKEDYQQMGMGSYLTQMIFQYAREKGIPEIRSKAYANNEMAKKMFENMRDQSIKFQSRIDEEYIYFKFVLQSDFPT
ncbi:MAG: GNAT family N-acetyltransferase [Bdellovibrionales bacterium]|nr:GNAT family N-acetyltransferase [Bdellovibrionales bacterium]